MNNCEQTNDKIIDGLTGNLDPEGRKALERHLAGCAGCCRESEAMQTLWAALADVRHPATVGKETIGPVRYVGRSRWKSLVGLAAATVIGLVGGYATGASRPAADTADDGRTAYLALLRQAGPLLGPDVPPESALVREYTEWAGGLAENDRLIAAERLNDFDARFLGPDGQAGPRGRELAPHISGFFLIRADDFADASRAVRQMPHLRYGGWIELRESKP